jgi:hypothetical protein
MSPLMLDSGINRQGAFSLGIFKLLLQRRIYTVEIDDASQGVLIQAPIRGQGFHNRAPLSFIETFALSATHATYRTLPRQPKSTAD